MVGQRVAVLVKKVQQAGEHEVVWNANNLASGIYFFKIKAAGINGKSDFSAYKKAVLLK